ncbi:PhzF family phenazine biosynthesis protein [Marinivivus vitaminiproducens]|uniref:PhzF family phenazine biosynthesis protein n=1 Tax=Marinivivus vitaminiproducens TaxID=3035935 RepID=UPI0027A8D858|nr:PhzF family phenazine biosynthesis protein [Geminicoccaceae bacterium SCSIO 64248]
MRDAEYVLADVFTETPYQGNPLAVFPDGRGLDARQMQAIARELNLAETTFVLPPETPGALARVRIFTPVEELPFAGHPTVGTAVVLARADGPAHGRERIVFDLGVGPVAVRLGEGGRYAELEREGAAERRELEVPADLVLSALGLGDADAAGVPWQASFGVPFLLVPLRDREAVARARLATGALDALADRLWASRLVYPFAVLRAEPGAAHLRARMFAPAIGVPEDPATGAGATALAGSIRGLEAKDGRLGLTIDQGVEMGRPSRIDATALYRGDAVASVRIGGFAVPIGRGALTPP